VLGAPSPAGDPFSCDAAGGAPPTGGAQIPSPEDQGGAATPKVGVQNPPVKGREERKGVGVSFPTKSSNKFCEMPWLPSGQLLIVYPDSIHKPYPN